MGVPPAPRAVDDPCAGRPVFSPSSLTPLPPHSRVAVIRWVWVIELTFAFYSYTIDSVTPTGFSRSLQGRCASRESADGRAASPPMLARPPTSRVGSHSLRPACAPLVFSAEGIVAEGGFAARAQGAEIDRHADERFREPGSRRRIHPKSRSSSLRSAAHPRSPVRPQAVISPGELLVS